MYSKVCVWREPETSVLEGPVTFHQLASISTVPLSPRWKTVFQRMRCESTGSVKGPMRLETVVPVGVMLAIRTKPLKVSAIEAGATSVKVQLPLETVKPVTVQVSENDVGPLP